MSCSFSGFHISLKPPCGFQESQQSSQVLSVEDAVIGSHPNGISSQVQTHSSHVGYFDCSMDTCGVRLGGSGQSCYYILSNCSTVSVFYAYDKPSEFNFLLSFCLWKPEDANPHSPTPHPRLFRQLPDLNLIRCTKSHYGSDLQIRIFHI